MSEHDATNPESDSSALDALEALPVFPLTGVLLLPKSQLPLQVFEPRYCNLLEDVVAGDGRFGIVQPHRPTPGDLRGDSVDEPASADGSPSSPRLYEVGCVGRIEHVESLPGGRFFVLLQGLRRYRMLGEHPLHRGYRRVRAVTAEFAGDDGAHDAALDPAPVLEALEQFGRRHPIDVDLDALREVDGAPLVDGVSMALPFAPAEKQALLEAPTVAERRDMLVALLTMGLEFGIETPRPN